MGKLFGLLGHPVGHSMSPHIHNDAYRQLDLAHHYQSFDVPEQQLKAAVEGLKALGVAGFNVTIPHKVAIMDLVDEIDEEAKIIGAINTVVNKNGRLIGYNTDGEGYLQSLLTHTGERLKEMNVLVIGAGGAARAVLTVLDRYSVRTITITNRTLEKAEKLAAECVQNVKAETITLTQAEENLHDYQLIINTTSVGMSPNVEEMPISLENLRADAVVSDLIYNPVKTKLLLEAEKKGATAVSGIGMFVGQGALAFEKWLGIEPDRERMEQIVLQHLEGKHADR